MTRESAIKWATEIKALQEGKTIQFRASGKEKWMDIPDPAFHECGGHEYRIKPEPHEFWENKYEGYCVRYESAKDAKSSAGRQCIRIAVHYREVMEENQ